MWDRAANDGHVCIGNRFMHARSLALYIFPTLTFPTHAWVVRIEKSELNLLPYVLYSCDESGLRV